MLLCAVVSAFIAACSGAGAASRESSALPRADGHLFSRLPPAYTGIAFENRVVSTPDFNVFTYRNFYNGGGVAAGDLTGDGLPELVLTSNQGGPRLYLNLGAFRFRDITQEAGIVFKGNGAWATGVTMADVNGDGLLDIYVCYAGNGPPERRANELWVNQGLGPDSLPHFKEMAAQYGIADAGYSTQGVFFDYDRDGLLDLFVLNNSPRPVSSFSMNGGRDDRSRFGGHKLYHNVGGRFVDVTRPAGISEAEIAFGLGAVASDVNGDGWPDLYVANDFFEKDYLYINNHDGTFTQSIERATTSISYSSMGMDIADVDNDSRPDIYTTDMLPEDQYRLQTTTAFESWTQYAAKVKNGFHHQFTRNMLQLNNGDGTFSEIGQMAGVARTDWSWGALIADFDLDGNKDIFVTNGVAKDVTAQDYLAYLAEQRTAQMMARGRPVDFIRLLGAATSTRLPNYAFHNNGDRTFTNSSAAWGLNTPSFSTSSVYADLDGDGALDLVVNNVDDTAFVYRNNARTLTPNRYVQVRLEGDAPNRLGVGAKVTVFVAGHTFFQEQMPTRGFQSSVDDLLTFGVGPRDTVDSVVVAWPGIASRPAHASTVRHVAANQRILLRESESLPASPVRSAQIPRLLADVTAGAMIPFVHHGNDFVDFEREPLIPKLVSREGPLLAVADVNGDGLDDFFIGGAKGQAGALLVQRTDGTFVGVSDAEFAKDSASEDIGAVFFDANGDGHPDLYVVSGGNEFSAMAPALQDRLYLNDGHGHFRKADGYLPVEHSSGSRVAAADFDGDGHIDLFVGGRVVPWRYGVDPESMLLRNDGTGHFTDVTDQIAPGLRHIGMVTDAVWRDIDGDGRPDLIVVGEWMPITIFRNLPSGKLERLKVPGLEKTNGWWNRIIAGDFTGHGRVDFIVGNMGLNNSLLRASPAEPTTMYVSDFAGDGLVQSVLTTYRNGVSYPVSMRDELINAIPPMRQRFPTYASYAKARTRDVFSAGELAAATVKNAYAFATSLVRNDGNGSFTVIPLPAEAQRAPVYGMLAGDFDGDGRVDVLLGGNFDGMPPELGGRMAASRGLLLRGDGRGAFTPVPSTVSGFVVPGETRDIQRLQTALGELIVVARNNDRPMAFRVAASQARVAAKRDTSRARSSRAKASSF